MGHSYGYRSHTRKLFARDFRKKGTIAPSVYQKVYRIGDLVDIKVNGAVHKGMPHKFYHGKTGIVYNVTPKALGVIINKKLGNRYIEKKILVRVEHVKPSRSREEFLERVKRNAERAKGAKVDKVKFDLKRKPQEPLLGHLVSIKKRPPITVRPEEYKFVI